jgi:hypothetical protein
MSTRLTFIGRARTLLAYPQDVDEADYMDLLATAASYYSRLRPKERYFDTVGDGSSYSIPVPSDWDDSFSVVKSVEHPAGKRAPIFLRDGRDYVVYKSTGATVIRLLEVTPSATETTRVCYSATHTITDDSSSVPVHDEEAVSIMLASFIAFALSARYAQISDSGLGADSVDYSIKAAEMRKVAQELDEKWKGAMGFREGIPAASGIGDYDLSFSWQRDFIIHRSALG